MSDLELELLGDIVEEIAQDAKPARADRIRELRDKVFTAKLLRRMPKPEAKSVIWNDPRFWTVVFALVVILATALGLEVPKQILTGGK